MLEYKININDLHQESTVNIPIYPIEVYEDDDDFENIDIICYYDPLNGTVNDGDQVIGGFTRLEYSEDVGIIETDETRTYTAEYTNPELGYFQITDKRFLNLTLTNIIYDIDEDNHEYIDFVFEDGHYFMPTDDIRLWVQFTYNGDVYEYDFRCQYHNSSTLRWFIDPNYMYLENFLVSVFSNDYYEQTDEVFADAYTVDDVPLSANIYSPQHIRVPNYYICEGNETIYSYTYYDKKNGQGSLYNLNCYRERLFFNNNETSVMVTKTISNNGLIIPISQNFDVRTFQEENISEYFVRAEAESAINPIVDMEKMTYKPVIPVLDENNIITGYEEALKIIFNLHFRKHRGDDWTCTTESLWNGVDDNGNFIASNFSFDNYSDQSDVLWYLGFSDNDVRYQKSKIKKSFIRLSFYDSVDSGSQNLLAYSTVYLDSGYLYSKDIKCNDLTPYKTVEGFEHQSSSIVGVRTYTEPDIALTSGLSDDEIENKRLSSRITIDGESNSKTSSEGYNLYLWSDNTMRVPTDIYMKVEFNHAGYGRVIPFMMPYVYPNNNNNPMGIKSFGDIINDWTIGDGYGIKLYNNYSYIHFKYRYDEYSKRYIYYMDNDTYGDSVGYQDKNVITIDLYEAKVSFVPSDENNS